MKKQPVKKKKTISLIVLNYNGLQHLDGYFKSVFAQTRVPDEIILFDNLCTDGSREFVKKKFPKVKIITEDRYNTGTALAINTAFKYTHGDYVILQSNDIVLDKKCVEILYKNINADPEVGIVSSITIRFHNKKLRKFIVDQAGGLLDKFGFGMQNYPNIPIKDIPDTGEVFFAYGDSIIFRREIFKKVNGFDTRMFMLNDDIDFSWRVRQLGYKIIYTKHSFVYHKGSATIKSLYKRPQVRYWSERNSIRCYLKNTSFAHFLKTFPMYIVLLCAEMGYFFYRGRFSLFFSDVRAAFWNVFYIPEILYLRFLNWRNAKKNNIDSLIVNKSFKLMLFKNFSKTI
jgi:hypothetical protein